MVCCHNVVEVTSGEATVRLRVLEQRALMSCTNECYLQVMSMRNHSRSRGEHLLRHLLRVVTYVSAAYGVAS
jgi:hypothetical protein